MEREKQVGVWHESKASLRFWLLTIFTLSLYYFVVYKHNSIVLTRAA